jgi:hypothetical protein
MAVFASMRVCHPVLRCPVARVAAAPARYAGAARRVSLVPFFGSPASLLPSACFALGSPSSRPGPAAAVGLGVRRRQSPPLLLAFVWHCSTWNFFCLFFIEFLLLFIWYCRGFSLNLYIISHTKSLRYVYSDSLFQSYSPPPLMLLHSLRLIGFNRYCSPFRLLPFMLEPILTMIAHIISQFSSFGFSGSRSSRAAATAAQAVFGLLPIDSAVSVGCAAGVDRAVRAAFPAAQVFRVSEFGGASQGAAAFARRSTALVQAVGIDGGLLLVFPSTACPAAVQPSRRFAGSGSGSWGSAALAVGLGVAVLVRLPEGVLPPLWLAAAAGFQEVKPSFWFVPAPASLF